jgi:hypothetical protein
LFQAAKVGATVSPRPWIDHASHVRDADRMDPFDAIETPSTAVHPEL